MVHAGDIYYTYMYISIYIYVNVYVAVKGASRTTTFGVKRILFGYMDVLVLFRGAELSQKHRASHLRGC